MNPLAQGLCGRLALISRHTVAYTHRTSLAFEAALIRILIVDGNMLIRTGIRTVLFSHLSETRRACHVEEAASGADALARLRAQRWNLCLLDVSIRERGGLEILRYIRKTCRQTRVLLLGSYAERQFGPLALRSGARGFLLKDCSREELIAAYRAVIDGRCYVSPEVSEQFLTTNLADVPPHARLSQREFQIFQKLARGTAIIVISRELSISPKSVSTYRARILEKMRCKNNAEITQCAMREGLI
jgi:two-component system, NarL family, invasion response regulator UvrY